MRALADDHVGDDGVERLLEDRLIEPVHVGPMRDKRASSQVGTDLRTQDLLPVVQDLLAELVERALQGVGAFRGAAMPEMVFFVVALATNQHGAAARADALPRQSRHDSAAVCAPALGPLPQRQSPSTLPTSPPKPPPPTPP